MAVIVNSQDALTFVSPQVGGNKPLRTQTLSGLLDLSKITKTGRNRIDPGERIHLGDYDPNDTSGYKEGKDKAEEQEFERLSQKLAALQDKLWAEHNQKLLIVLQGMDTSGKDGVIRRVFEGVNPQGVKVAHFGEPTPEELDHDFLWRVHKQVPAKGEIAIFNRSHYEEVLIVRVHKLVPDHVWHRRYREINDFERFLAEDGTTILKFYLHIDKDEQKKRLEARLADPTKNWKFRTADLPERKHWDEYMQAYEDMLIKTSTEFAPWYLIPANHKWYRDLLVSQTIVKTLERMDPQYPKRDIGPIKIE